MPRCKDEHFKLGHYPALLDVSGTQAGAASASDHQSRIASKQRLNRVAPASILSAS